MDRGSGINRQATASVRVLALVALAASLVVVVVRAQPHAPAERSAAPATAQPRFGTASLAALLGRPSPSAPLARRVARDTEVRFGGAGVTVSHGPTTVSLATLVDAAGAWRRHANGVARTTDFGRETVALRPTGTEIFLHVDRRQNARTWTWRLSGDVIPQILPGGAVLLHGKRPLEIRPVKIFDSAGADVTPAGSRWSVRQIGSQYRLQLRLDDSHLPLPYVIDPEVVTTVSYRSVVASDGTTVDTLDGGGPSLVANIASNTGTAFTDASAGVSLGSIAPPAAFELWFSVPGGHGQMPFWSNRTAGGVAGDLFFGISAGLVFAYNDDGHQVVASGTWDDGQPHQAVFVDSGGTASIYIDGQLRGSGAIGTLSGAHPANLGFDAQPCPPGCGSQHLTGTLDEYSTYAGLTPTQVQQHYLAGTDDTPPTIAIAGQDGNAAAIVDLTRTQSTSATFTPTVGADAVTVECNSDGAGWVACTSGTPVALAGPLDGSGVQGTEHTFAVRASDQAGNVRETTVRWTVDTSPPTARVAATIDRRANTTSYVLGSDDAIGTFQCSIDGGAAAACTSPVNLAGISHTIAVTATDDVGNAQTAPPVSPPSLTSATVPSARTASNAFSFTFAPAGGTTVTCRTDADPFGACTTGTTYGVSGLSGGSSPASPTGDEHTVDITATDGTGDNSTTQHFRWTVDTTAPTVTIDSQPPDPSNTATFTFHSDETQAGSVVRCTLDGTAVTASSPVCTSPKSFASGLSEASHTAHFLPIDDVGNQGSVVDSTPWTYDVTNPSLALTNASPAAGSRTASTSASFTFDPPADSSGIASVVCKLDGVVVATPSCTSPFNVSGLSGGSASSPHGDSHTVEIVATDNAGNPTTVSRTWTVDTTAPTTTVTQATNTGAGTTAFTFSANESLGITGGFQCSFNGGAFAACTSPLNRSSTTDTIAVKATDDLGNAESPAKSPPALSIDTGPPAMTASTSASFDFTAGGVSSECKIETTAFAPCTTPYSVSGVSTGAHVATIKTTDADGNWTSRTRNWTVDQTGPTISIIAKPALTTTSTAATFQFNASDPAGADGSTFLCKLDGVDPGFVGCPTGTQAYSGLAVGSHTFHITVEDTLGNLGSTDYTWTILPPPTGGGGGGGGAGTSAADRTAPSAPTDFHGVVQADGLSLFWGPATDDVAIGHYFLWIDGLLASVFGNTTFQAPIGPFGPGDTRVFKLSADDSSGNVGPTAPALTGVPTVVGLDLDAARAAIVARGFAVGAVTTQAAPEAPGTVLSQAPASPGVAAVGSAVDLVVSQQGGQAQLVMDLTAAHRVLLAQRNFIAVRVALSIPASIQAALLDRKSHRVARWHRSLDAGATIVRLTLPRAIRHSGVYRLRVDAKGGGQTVRRTLSIRLVGPSMAKARPIKRARVDVVLVNGPDLRSDIALGLNQRFTLQYVAGPKVFDVAASTSTPPAPVAVAVVDVTADTLGVVSDLHLLFPELRIIAVADSGETGGLATTAGATLVLTKPVSAAVIAASIQALSSRA